MERNDMYEKLETFFTGNPLAMAGLVALFVALMLLCFRWIKYFSGTVMPKRVSGSIDRERCAGMIEGKLRGFAAIHECRMLRDLRLGEGGSVRVDLLLIGLYGVTAFVGCDAIGELYPVDEEGPELTAFVSGQKVKYPNPMRERREAERLIMEILRTSGEKRGICEAVEVFTNSRTTLVTSDQMKLTSIKDLPKLMRLSKYDGDAGIDIERVESIFMDRSNKE